MNDFIEDLNQVYEQALAEFERMHKEGVVLESQRSAK